VTVTVEMLACDDSDEYEARVRVRTVDGAGQERVELSAWVEEVLVLMDPTASVSLA